MAAVGPVDVIRFDEWMDRALYGPSGFYTTGGRAGGAGLGLAIARDLVRAHGGDIALLESNGKGTIFQFTLPA